MAKTSSNNNVITTFDELIKEYENIGENKLLTDDPNICNIFSSINIEEVIPAIQQRIIETKGKTTFGDIIAAVIISNIPLLCPDCTSVKLNKINLIYEIVQKYSCRLEKLLSLLNANPEIINKEVKIDFKKFMDGIIAKQKDVLYMRLIHVSHPENFNDIEAYRYCVDKVYIQITKAAKYNHNMDIRYNLIMVLPDGSEEFYAFSVSSLADIGTLIVEADRINRWFRNILKNKNLI